MSPVAEREHNTANFSELMQVIELLRFPDLDPRMREYLCQRARALGESLNIDVSRMIPSEPESNVASGSGALLDDEDDREEEQENL